MKTKFLFFVSQKFSGQSSGWEGRHPELSLCNFDIYLCSIYMFMLYFLSDSSYGNVSVDSLLEKSLNVI